MVIPVVLEPTVAVGDSPVRGTSTFHSLLFIIGWGDSDIAIPNNSSIGFRFLSILDCAEHCKQSAVYNATEDSEYDMILSPQYTIEDKNYLIYRKINCTVKGFPGKITKVTPVKGAMPPVNINVER